ncbi:MAG: DUF748 domain-containing protein, partial [Burkholderiales bacterium]|nr:DUF748 domain-containing protein [Burkholderiales bacterium]
PKVVAKELQHQASVGDVRFDPFSLDLEARDLGLNDARGGALLSIKQLEVKLDWASITRRAWSFAHVRVGEPRVNLEISPQGRLNFADLIDALNREPPDPDKRLPRLLLDEVKVSAGRVDFNDRQAGVKNALSPIDFQLANISTLPEHNGPHTLTARTANGGAVRWKGQASLNPIAGSGEVVVEALALAALQPYVKDHLSAVVTDGRLAMNLPYRFAYAGGKVSAELQKAGVTLESFVLTHAGGAPLLSLPSLKVEGVDASLESRQASIAALSIVGGRVAVKRDAKGVIDLATLVKAQPAQVAAAPPAPAAAASGATTPAGPAAAPAWQLALQKLRVEGFAAEYADRSGAAPLDVTIAKLGLEGSAGLADGVLKARVESLGATDIALGPRAAPLVKLASVTAGAAALDLGARSLAIDRVAFGPVAAKVGVDAKGRVDLLDMLPAAGTEARAAAPAGPTAAPLAVTVSAIDFERIAVDVDDRSREAKVAAQIARLKVGAIAAGAGLQVKSVDVDGLAADLEHPQAQVRGQGGRLKLAGLLADAKQPGGFRLGLAELGGMVADIDAKSVGIKLRAEDLRARVTDLSGDPRHALGFDVGLRLREGGDLSARGKAVAASGTVDADVKVERLALAIAQPFLSKVIRLKLASGTASAEGKLVIGGKGPWLRYSGAAGIANLLLNEEDGKQFAALKFGGGAGMDVQLKPDAIEIPELRLEGPQAELFIDADRTLNAVRLLVAAPSGATAASTPSASPGAASPGPPAVVKPAPPVATADAPLPPIVVRRMRITDGKLDFQDLSLRPQFGAKIHELNGVITGLSTSPSTRSRLELDGRVDEFGSARIRGELNPFFPRVATDVAMIFRNVDMTTATPYAMKFAGYRIASGKISLDLGYKVRDNQLEGDNKVVIDQLTLGERVDSPDALRLPLALAIAILKDSDGRIDLGLPVSGSLDDPQFSYGALVWKAVVNVLTRVVTAPFRALGSLFGGDGARLESITFDGGSAQVAPPEREKLRQVAQVLAKRPQLKLAIPAAFDEALDAPALRERAARVEILRRAGHKLGDGENPGPLDPQDRAQRAALRDVFLARHGAPALEKLKDDAERGALGDAKGGKPQAPPVWRRAINLVQGEPQVADPGAYYGAIAARLSESQPLPADALARLASERAAAVAAALREAGVDAARVAAGKPQPAAGGGKQVELKLGLEAR